MILQTKRLYLRKLTAADYADLCKILQDPQVMYAYEHAFSDQEVTDWLNKQQLRYQTDGFGLWAMLLKETDIMIGQAGLTLQDIGEERPVIEVGYLLQKAYWHRGYATEAAIACKQYAFEQLQCDKVYSIIRENNLASQKVAERNGMQKVGQLIKYYYGMTMPHNIYCVAKAPMVK